MSEQTASRILNDIADGAFAVGEPLPAEAQLAETYSVSRLTVREAIVSLASRGVVEVRHGKRSTVAPVASWSVLDPAILMLRGRLTEDSARLVMELIEARRVLEIAFARLAATRITDAEIADLRCHLGAMVEALDDDDALRSAQADLRFHRGIVEAAGNPFLAGSYAPLEHVLMAVRIKTSTPRSVRQDAITWHGRILEALEARDPARAAAAMQGHMDQTADAASGMDLGRPEASANSFGGI
ncbi:FadR/GntR family transcriptional regulator [Falsarthrobacter nasiphocae]|uniref:DNA-binding FadR family transcriptional regulator n=2 Tax=Falsarthrobacter nasiphocae TaxID=189863 RepID=A0AAE3YI12_9MICC|nr:FadR/GntR family transcriptional regulator [Falsarthrobacter nasiphocae]MDR6892126.1 DNA-binding FadR family transcriptional regulator [Falsarthrobacter nasiphocae]